MADNQEPQLPKFGAAFDPLRLLELTAYHLYLATLGNGTPANAELHELLYHPGVGDLVLETTTFGRAQHDGDRMGRLVAIESEQIADDAHPYSVWLIRTVDGRELRWRNARFIRIIERPEDYPR